MESPTGQERLKLIATRWAAAQPVVAAFIGSLVPSFHDAEDLLQHTAAAAIMKQEDYDPNLPFVNWAIGLARVEVLRHHRKKVRDLSRTVFDSETVDVVAAAFEREVPSLEEGRAALGQCLEKLRGRLLEVVKLHYIEGLSTQAVGERLGSNSSAVLAALHRARVALRQCVERRLRKIGELP